MSNVDVAAGELVAVVGRSGSGKSTLLQIAGGLDRPDAGTVEVNGRPVTGASERELSALRRDAIGFVFQFFHLLPELDGEANVMLPARLPGARPGGRERGRELIDRLGLRAVAGLAPHQLSGGEQQRFALARALVGDPLLVLADEPVGNLDADIRRGRARPAARGRRRGTRRADGHPPGRGDGARRPRPAAAEGGFVRPTATAPGRSCWTTPTPGRENAAHGRAAGACAHGAGARRWPQRWCSRLRWFSAS